ncbi:DUF3798 domain-containing protein [Fusobacterium sp. SB021]|uniref:DUF3798 domain-containing protein n=1 Tax=Fusobacterium sp. SB021 TaxID=2744227 RepID=UPI003CF16229
MKKFLMGIFMALLSVFAFAEADYHIGIVTGTVSQSEDAARGAEAAIARYGAAEKGGKIVHVTYPDNFMQEMETTISQIASLADDPKMKAIIMGEGVPGTVEAYRRIREKRPDILLLTNSAHEDPEMVAEVVDLALETDIVARGHLIVLAAKQLGADKFMHISFPRHLSYEIISRRRNIMKETAKDLGMEFIDMSAPDPVSDVGVAGAQQFILEQVPNWLEKYGQNTAFFATNNSHTEPLLKRIAEKGGYFIEADLPSPTMGYPGALGIKFDESEKGNWQAILKKVEKSVIDANGAGRMGTWAYSYSFTGVLSLTDHAMNVIEGKCEMLDFDAFIETLKANTPGAGWNGSYYIGVDGVEKENFLMIYQDTYILGKGYLHMTDIEVPEKYFEIK